jgi:hypothetical protein
MTKYRLSAVLLVGTGRARATYHGVTIVRVYPALYVYGVVLQERDDYNMVHHGH